MRATSDLRQRRPRRRAAAIVLGVALVAVVAYFALGMPGMDHSGEAVTGMNRTALGDPIPLKPDVFAERLADSSAFVVNVHIPTGATIAGTDAVIPYDRIVGDARLPAAKDVQILVYCQTGRMSQTAGRALLAAGYADVLHLDGGMQAWQRAGLPLVEK